MTKSERRKARMKTHTVISVGQRHRIGRARKLVKVRSYSVGAHDRRAWGSMDAQLRKLAKIDRFAREYVAMLDRHGVTREDKQAIRDLLTLLDDAGAMDRRWSLAS